MSSVNNGIPFVPENTIDPAAGLNDSINIIDALLQLAVVSVGANTPPGTPPVGARYIVGTSPTGAWANRSNQVARWLDGAWQFFAARYALNLTDGAMWVRQSTGWSPLAGGGGGSGGEANTGANIGDGEGLYSGKVGVELQFKSLMAGANVTLSGDGDTVTISASGGGSGGGTVESVNGVLPDDGGNVELGPSDIGLGDLGSAAFSEDSDFATSAQGAAADSAVQPEDLSGLERLLTAGANITIDRSNPLVPVISASGGGSGGGTVESVNGVLPDGNGNVELNASDMGALAEDAEATDSAKLGGVIATEFYRRADILGVVSQSGGMPTGAIIESGSNNNGDYVRFADGTQICRKDNLTISKTATTSEVSWNFPAAFVAPPLVVPLLNGQTSTGGDGRNAYSLLAYGETSSVVRLLLSLLSGATAQTGSWTGNKALAYGRWY